MSRQMRKLSKSSIYHVMIRGNERKNVFPDDEDKTRFIDTLFEKKKEKEYYLYAYCLMDNHVHLLIKEGSDRISRVMKRINTSYAYYFNKKFDRVGHVFQDRYKSEVIEADGYLLAATRYIHNNPVKANIVIEPSQYRWSSYNSYIGKGNASNQIVDKDEILEMYSQKQDNAIKLFIEYTSISNDDCFLEHDDDDKKELSEKKAAAFIEDFLRKRNLKKEIPEIQKDVRLRDELIREMKDGKDLSVRQIASVLGVNRNIVQRIK